jgi:hypothetical protein
MGKAECTGGRAAKGMCKFPLPLIVWSSHRSHPPGTVSCCPGVNVTGPRRAANVARDLLVRLSYPAYRSAHPRFSGVLNAHVSGLSHHCAPSSPSISPPVAPCSLPRRVSSEPLARARLPFQFRRPAAVAPPQGAPPHVRGRGEGAPEL